MARHYGLILMILLLGASLVNAEQNTMWRCKVKKSEDHLEIVISNEENNEMMVSRVSGSTRLINLGTFNKEILNDNNNGLIGFNFYTHGDMGLLFIHMVKTPEVATMLGYGLEESLELFFLECSQL